MTINEVNNEQTLNGLVLIGGQSRRMGTSKAFVEYKEGKPQLEVVFESLELFCKEVYISKRLDQSLPRKYVDFAIDDVLESRGPLSGILAAFVKNTSCAWLVVACDLPFFSHEAVTYLINHRNTLKSATAFCNSQTGDPEPLCAIYESNMREVLQSKFDQGVFCPRRILKEENVHLLNTPNPDWLQNINTVEEKEKALKFFQEDGKGNNEKYSY